MSIRKYVYPLHAPILALCAIIFAGHAIAQEITSNHVYQKTDDIIAQLERLHDANMTVPDLSKVDLALPERQPRHAILQALNVRMKLQVLKEINGMESEKIALPPVKKIAPSDVMAVVETVLAELKSFDKAYGLPAFKESAPLPQDKTSTDVYLNLLKAQEMLIQLGIPETIPNEVFDNAALLSEEIKKVAAASGKKTDVDPPSPSIGKLPADAYTLAYYALKALQGLSKKPEYTITGGVVIPKRKTRNITSNDVQQILIASLGEVAAMKLAVGAKDDPVIPAPSAGQTPSSVFDQLGLVNRQIQSMQW